MSSPPGPAAVVSDPGGAAGEPIPLVRPLDGCVWKAPCGEDLEIRAGAPLARWSVRIDPAHAHVVEQIFDLGPALKPRHSAYRKTRAALWLGPDEWLVLVDADLAETCRAQCRAIDWASAPPASVVEITHRNVGIEIRGRWAAWLLNCGCPLDLAERSFAAGACTRTLFGKAEIVLWRKPEPAFCYYLECWRSYAPYLWTLLTRSAQECVAQHGLTAGREPGAPAAHLARHRS